MVQLLSHILIVSVVFMIWGLPVLLYFRKKNQQYLELPGECILFLFFSGLILLSFVSSWMVLFLPLQFGYLLILTSLFSVSMYLLDKKNYKETLRFLFKFRPHINFSSLVFIVSSLLLFLVIGAASSVNIDTQMYHLQIVRWTNEFGTVPGLANIYPRLGLGSAWFNLISFFHIPLFKNQNFTYLNCTLVIWFFLWLFYKFEQDSRVVNKCNPLQLFYFLLLLYFFFDWQLFRDTANSTSYDFVVTALIIICISFILENTFKPHTYKFIIPTITIVALTVISFKLSGIFTLLLLIWQLIKAKKKSNWAFTFLSGILIILPVLIRNYIISGYPVYPINFTIGDPDWKLPIEFTQEIKKYIIIQNRYYNTIHQAPPDSNFLTLNWVPLWFKGILIQHKIICIAALFSIIIFFIKDKTIKEIKKVRGLIIILLLMSMGWFITAPDPRFGYGFLLYLAFLPISFFLHKYIKPIIFKILLWPITAGICFYLYKKGDFLIKDPSFLLHTLETQQPPYKEIKDLNTTFYVPEKIHNNWNSRCFFIPLPCLCEKNPFLRYRGRKIKNGFRMTASPDSAFIKNYTY